MSAADCSMQYAQSCQQAYVELYVPPHIYACHLLYSRPGNLWTALGNLLRIASLSDLISISEARGPIKANVRPARCQRLLCTAEANPCSCPTMAPDLVWRRVRELKASGFMTRLSASPVQLIMEKWYACPRQPQIKRLDSRRVIIMGTSTMSSSR